MGFMGTKKIRTPRLVLRPFELSDADIMFKNWANDSEVTKYLTWTAHKSAEDTRALLKSWTEKYNDSEYLNWAICLWHTNEPIGSIDLVAAPIVNILKSEREVGYCLGRDYWGKGIMTEALKAVAEYGFQIAGLKRIPEGI